jgi:hypothetical protein
MYNILNIFNPSPPSGGDGGTCCVVRKVLQTKQILHIDKTITMNDVLF